MEDDVTDIVTVTFAADTQNVALARTVAAAMAARADLPLDRLEDVRLAVDEAATEVIASAAEGATVTCAFDHDDSVLYVTVQAPTTATEPPSPTSFGWTVLSALVDSASAEIVDGVMSIRLQVSSDLVDV